MNNKYRVRVGVRFKIGCFYFYRYKTVYYSPSDWEDKTFLNPHGVYRVKQADKIISSVISKALLIAVIIGFLKGIIRFIGSMMW